MYTRPLLLIGLLLVGTALFPRTPERVIVKLKAGHHAAGRSPGEGNGTGNAMIDALTRDLPGAVVERVHTGRQSPPSTFVIQLPPDTDADRLMDAYRRSGEVEYVERDHQGLAGGVQGVVPTDTSYPLQWGLSNQGTFALAPAVAGADIQMEDAWTVEQGDGSITVAIIDTGTKWDHPEFAGRIWTNTAEIAGNGVDDDGNGLVDDIRGWDFANNDNDPMDDQGHGTNVTGIIGAQGDNGIGFAGVDWNCKLMSLKALDSDSYGYYSWWASAIHYAVDHGAQVINMSIGGTSSSSTLSDVVNYALSHGVVVVACMMNTNTNTTFYPAGIPGVIAVGSTDPDDTRSAPFFWSNTSGSNFGAHISVVAPGNYIYGLSHLSNSNYSTYWGGTSQATPLVAGLAALLLASSPGLSPAEVKTIVETSAEDMVGAANEDTPGWDPYHGHGRVNAFNALTGSVGTRTADLMPTFTVFPNPTEGTVTVQLPEHTQRLEVYDAQGRSIHRWTGSARSTTTLQLTTSGLYYIEVATATARQGQRLIVR